MNIRERSIEGFKVGDSLYDHFTKKEINKLIKKEENGITMFVVLNEPHFFPNYMVIRVYCLTKDKKLNIFYIEATKESKTSIVAIEEAQKIWKQIENRYPRRILKVDDVQKPSLIDSRLTTKFYKDSLMTEINYIVNIDWIRVGVVFWKNNDCGHIEIKIKNNLQDKQQGQFIPWGQASILRVNKNVNNEFLSDLLKDYKENGSIEKSIDRHKMSIQ